MFAIGVGNDTNKEELESIASSDQFVYEVGSYDALSGIKSTVANTACKCKIVLICKISMCCAKSSCSNIVDAGNV